MRAITWPTMGSTALPGRVNEAFSVTNWMVLRVLSRMTWQVLHSCRCSSRRTRNCGSADSSRYSPNSVRNSAQLSIVPLPVARKVRSKTFAQHQSSAQDACLERRHADFKRCGRFFTRQLADVAQDQCHPIFFRQSQNSLAYQLISLRGREDLLRVVGPPLNLPRAEVFIVVNGSQRLGVFTMPQHLSSRVNGDAYEPSGKLRPPLKPRYVLKCLQEHILCSISRVVEVPYDPGYGSEDATRMTPDKFFEN